MDPDPANAGRDTTRARVREVFAQRGFRRLFAARAVSQLGDGIFQLAAAAVLLFEAPGDNPALSLLGITAVVLIPFSALGPFAGVFIDRWERRKILTRVPVLRAFVAAMAPLAASGGTRGIAYYAVVLFVLSSNRFFLATMSASLPQLVPEDDLIVANSAATIGGSIANVLGQGVGAVVAGAIGGEKAGALAAIAFVAGAVAARRIPVHRGFEPERAALGDELREVVREMVDGIRTVRTNRRVVYGLSAIGVVQILVGALTGVLTVYAIQTLELTVTESAAILGVLAVGIGGGVVLVPLAARRMRHDLLVPAALAIAAFGALFAGVTGLTRATALAGTIVVGISYAFAKIPVDVIVQEEMADAFRGRAFAVYDVLFNVARVAGVAIVAIAYERGATSGTLITGIGVVYLIAAGVFRSWERRLQMPIGWRRRRRKQPGDLLVPGELVRVRAYAGARADEEPRALVIGGHEVPVDEILWRAVVEEGGARRRAFVVRASGKRVRISIAEDATSWEIERVSADPPAG